jgi:hypothetical protein
MTKKEFIKLIEDMPDNYEIVFSYKESVLYHDPNDFVEQDDTKEFIIIDLD